MKLTIFTHFWIGYIFHEQEAIKTKVNICPFDKSIIFLN